MFANTIVQLPMHVCALWTLVLAADWYRERRTEKLLLAIFGLAATLLYAGHYAYFSRQTTLLPLTDTVYCAMNLAVFPLYYMYLCRMTDAHHSQLRQIVCLLPAAAAGIAASTLYALMSPDETAAFVQRLYGTSAAERNTPPHFAPHHVAAGRAHCRQGGVRR